MKKHLCALALALLVALCGLMPAQAFGECPVPEDLVSRFSVPFEGSLDEHYVATSDFLSRATADGRSSLQFEGEWDDGAMTCDAYSGSRYDMLVLHDGDGSGSVYAYAFVEILDASVRNRWGSVWTDCFPSMIEAIASAVWIDAGRDDDVYSDLMDLYGELDVPAISAAVVSLDPNAAAPYFGHYITAFRTPLDSGHDCYWFVYHNTPASGESQAKPDKTAAPEPTAGALALPGLAAQLNVPFRGNPESLRAAFRVQAEVSARNGEVELVESADSNGYTWERWHYQSDSGSAEMYLLFDYSGGSLYAFACPFTSQTTNGFFVSAFRETALLMDAGFDGTYADFVNGTDLTSTRELREAFDEAEEYAAIGQLILQPSEKNFTRASTVYFGHNATILRDPANPDVYWYFYHNAAIDGLAAVETAAAGEWQCPACGATNDNNFCYNCGAKRPEPAPAKCPSCGWVIPEGTSPKFCQDCGARLEEEAPSQCPSCGWLIPEGTSPRFCQDCGARLRED